MGQRRSQNLPWVVKSKVDTPKNIPQTVSTKGSLRTSKMPVSAGQKRSWCAFSSPLFFFFKYLFIYLVAQCLSCGRQAPWLQLQGFLVADHWLPSCGTWALSCGTWALSCGMRILSCGMHVGSSSLTRDWTRASCIGSMKSYPLCHQGSPIFFLVFVPPSYSWQMCSTWEHLVIVLFSEWKVPII